MTAKDGSAILYPDVAIEMKVDATIAAGTRLPRWGWAVPRPYNGATGVERVLGWQKIMIACRAGWLPWPTACTICGHDQNLHHHLENYFRALYVKPICRPCHYRLHRRFVDPDPWHHLTDRHSGWATMITMVELDREEAQGLATRPDPSTSVRPK